MTARYRWDDFVLDLDSYRLERDGRPLSLEPKAFNLLALLVGRPGHLFTKQEIFEAIWPDTAVTDHALTRVVAQVRRVLGDDVREVRYLETVPTRGYRWIYPIETGEVGTPVDPSVDARTVEWPAGPAERLRLRPAWFVLSGLLVVALVVAVVWGPWRAAPEPDQDGASPWSGPGGGRLPIQLTTHAGVDVNPAFSPQGEALAFASDRSGGFEIHVRTTGAGATDVAVTSDGGQNVQPAWSPDGRFLAYHSAAYGGIWVVPARGGVARQLVDRGSNPEWSPDGQQIVYQSDEHPDLTPTGYGAHVGATLWTVDAAGGPPEPLTTPGRPMGGHGVPAWSRDGRYVAFTVFDGGGDNGVWVVRVDTRDVTPVDRTPGKYESVFAENDTAIYVAGGQPIIYRLGFDPDAGVAVGAPQPIPVPGVTGVRGLSVSDSDDGGQMVFAGLDLSSHIWAQPVDELGQPTGAAYPLTSDTSRRNYVPAISPDGTRVAYMSARRGEAPNVWMMDLTTRLPTQLTEGEAFEREPIWFPDGRRIGFSSDQPGATGLRAIDVATRRQESIIRTDRHPEVAPGAEPLSGRLAEIQLSPSIQQVAFAMALPPFGFRRLYVARLSPFAPRTITDGTVSVGYPAWSRDERRLAVEIQRDGTTQLGVVDMASGGLRELTDLPGQVWARSWSPDGRRVAAAVLEKRRWSLEWFDAATGARATIVPPGPANVYYRYPEVSPAGGLVLFERGEMTGNIWRLTMSRAR